jgi:hypothetical protein
MLGNLMHTEKDPQAHEYESLLGILMHIEKDPQAHRYRCIFYLGVFQGIDFHGEREVC